MSSYENKARPKFTPISWNEFKQGGGDWGAYRKYLKDNGVVPKETNLKIPARAAPRKEVDSVPWYGMKYSEAKEKGLLPLLEKHIAELHSQDKERAVGYAKYLERFGYPKYF